MFQCGFYLSSIDRSAICWYDVCYLYSLRVFYGFSRPTVITGLFIQQTVALFVLKTGAGYSFFRYIASLAEDFLTQANSGAEFFFDAETIAKHWFYVNTVRLFHSSPLFSVALRFNSLLQSSSSLQLSRCFTMYVGLYI